METFIQNHQKKTLTYPIANSSKFVLPTITAPAAFKRSTTVASYMGTKFCNILEAHVVGTPLVQKLSLTAIGIPSRGLCAPDKEKQQLHLNHYICYVGYNLI